jgi:DNA (cytosine-5)-methyltransferase 1
VTHPYTRTLNEAWADHLAPREPDAPTVISTFAGCGGSSLGYSMAGFRELLAVEYDPDAVASFKINFPHVPVLGDITQIEAEQVLEVSGLQVGELDVFDGSPPCQGFSMAGRRQAGDPRNQLFTHYVRLVRDLQPRVMVMENVTGMVAGKMKLTFVACLRDLKAAGYRVSARVLNAAYYGVPQARRRLIFIGVRNDLDITPTHPAPYSRPIPCREAISDVVNDPAEVAMLRKAAEKNVSFIDWENVPIGKNRHAYLGKSGFNCLKFNPQKPANTIRKNDGVLGMHGAMHWAEKRRFTVREFARFGSFSDQFRFAGDYPQQVARIGNSVPPLLMRAIARHIREAILQPQQLAEAT